MQAAVAQHDLFVNDILTNNCENLKTVCDVTVVTGYWYLHDDHWASETGLSRILTTLKLKRENSHQIPVVLHVFLCSIHRLHDSGGNQCSLADILRKPTLG